MPNTEETGSEKRSKRISIQCLNQTQQSSSSVSSQRAHQRRYPSRLFEMTVADFASFVEAQPAARDAGETPFLEVLSLDIHGLTAVPG